MKLKKAKQMLQTTTIMLRASGMIPFGWEIGEGPSGAKT
jgi:hypothetical protein